MDKKTLIEIFTMRINGRTYQEIGEKYGFTKQHIEHELKNAINKEKSTYTTKYPQRQTVAKYMAENNLSIKEFSKLVGAQYSNISTFLRGESQSLKTATKIANCTGLSLDNVFDR